MNALGHFMAKKNNNFDLSALKRMKDRGETMVWKVVYTGRSNSRQKPTTSSSICDEYNEGDFVEVVDYMMRVGENYWLKIKGNRKGTKPVSWMLAVDPFCGLDLLIKSTKKEEGIARAIWGQSPRPKSPPSSPAEGGEGPSLPPSPMQNSPKSSPEIVPAPPANLPAKSQPLTAALLKKAIDSSADNKDLAFFEHNTVLRNLRLQAIQGDDESSSGDLPSPKKEVTRDGSRDQWKRGTKIIMFSQSGNRWYNATVYKVRDEGGLNETVEVHYKKDGRRNKKILPRYSKHLAPRKTPQTSSSDEKSADCGSPAKSSPRKLPSGWTEHRCKKSGRFYYYNKSQQKTLWDKDAMKHGIISEIKVRAAA